MNNPEWWLAWEVYEAAHRKYEDAVQEIRASAHDHEHAGLKLDRIRKEIIPQRNAAFEVFRAKFLSFQAC